MDKIILHKTKLYIPDLGEHYVKRTELVNKIKKGLTSSFVLISAPAGYGKTSLLCEWIGDDISRTAWYSLDSTDNDIDQFNIYLTRSLQQANPKICPHFGDETNISLLNHFVFVDNLLNDISKQKSQINLVIDDYHVITNPEIHKLIEYIISIKPQNLNFVLSTRADPPIKLSRIRLQNRLIEIRALDLRFSTRESLCFFNNIKKLRLSESSCTLLQNKTEGWIAGMQMAALSLEGKKDIAGSIIRFASDQRHIMDYLMEEVVADLDENLFRFLLYTSVLSRFNSSLCNTLTQRKDAHETILSLEKRNMFIVPLDSNREWYRYHHLFADLLFKRLQKTDKELIPELHKRAAKWFEMNGLLSEAVEQYLQSKDWQFASNLIEKTFLNRMKGGGDVARMLTRLEALPAEVISNNTFLSILYGWMLNMNWQLEESKNYLSKVEEKMESQLQEEHSYMIESIYAEQDRYYSQFDRCIERSLQLQEKLAHLPMDDPIANIARTGSCFNLVFSYLDKGDHTKIQSWCDGLDFIALSAGSLIIIMLQSLANGLYYTRIADAKKAENILKNGLAKYNNHLELIGQEVNCGAYVHRGLSELYLAQNRLKEALYHCNQALRIGLKYDSDPQTIRDSYVLKSDVLSAYEKYNEADHTISEAREKTKEYTKIHRFSELLDIAFYSNKLCAAIQHPEIKHPEFNELKNWFELTIPEPVKTIEDIYQEEKILLWVRYMILTEKSHDVIGILEKLRDSARNAKRYRSLIHIEILQCLALKSIHNIDDAANALSSALILAEPAGYVKFFIDEKRGIKDILAHIFQQKSGRNEAIYAFIRKLLLEFDKGSEKLIGNSISEGLSSRELDVLILLEKGLKNSEIAQKLFISDNTVKSHLKSINSKLNAKGRKEAVQKAREIGLI